MSDHGFQPLLAFDTDDPQFVRGFEAGCIWHILQRAKETGESVVQEFHAPNAEMVLRMAEALGVSVRAEEMAEPWMLLVVDGS